MVPKNTSYLFGYRTPWTRTPRTSTYEPAPRIQMPAIGHLRSRACTQNGQAPEITLVRHIVLSIIICISQPLFAVRTVDVTPGDVAGVKATTILVEGRYAYGYAQYESGTHSLVRISPFDKTGACRTSSANVRVFPCLDDDGISAAVDLKPADLQITNMRSHREGGPYLSRMDIRY